jgi:zinc transporter 1
MRVKKDIQVTVSEDGKDLPTEKKSKAKRDNKDNRVRLLCMIFLTFGYFLVEIIVGYMTDSVALVADSFHMLSDVISLIIAYIAVRMSVKKWSKNTFGWARAEVLGALVNAVFLVALCFTIVAESLER